MLDEKRTSINSEASAAVINPPQYQPRSDEEIAEDFYQRLGQIEGQVESYDSCCAKAACGTAGLAVDCGLPITSVALMAAHLSELGFVLGFIYAWCAGCSSTEIKGWPFCCNNLFLECYNDGASDAATPKKWNLDPDIALLLGRWQADIEAQANFTLRNIDKFPTENAVKSLNDIRSVKNVIATVYQNKFSRSIDQGISERKRQKESSALLMQ